MLVAFACGCTQSTPAPQAHVSHLTPVETEARLSQPVYFTTAHEHATIQGANETPLWIDLYRPADDPSPVPVILEYSPYQALLPTNSTCEDANKQDCPLDPELLAYFLPRGYAVAFADVPGYHDSGGCPDNDGPETAADGYKIVEWLGTQPWSNGRVGMYGASDDGTSQLITAALAPPHLTTIVPVAATTSAYGYYFNAGVPYFLQGPLSAASYFAISTLPGIDGDGAPSYDQRLGCAPQNLEVGMDQSGDWNQYWAARDHAATASRIEASVLQVQGFRDSNVKPDHIDGFWNNLTSEKRLIIGQWGHEDTTRPDWIQIRHRWFDYYLKGIDTGLLGELPPVLAENSAGEWRGIDSFPPLHAQSLTFYASSNGSLSVTPGIDGALALQDYPPGYYGNNTPQGAVLTTLSSAARRPQWILFETPPLATNLSFTGRPLVELVASTNAKSTHWVAHLLDLGNRATTPTAIDNAEIEKDIRDRGYLDARHRNGVDHPEDLTPGARYAATIHLLPTDTLIPAGHRLGLILTNTDDWVQQDVTYAESTVFVGGTDGTRLLLPVDASGVPFSPGAS